MFSAFNYPSFLWIFPLCFVNGPMWESLHTQTWLWCDHRSTFACEVLHLNACTFLDYCISTCSAFRRESGWCCLLMFNEVTLSGFQSNHKHSTWISPSAPAKETFLSLYISSRGFLQCRCPVIYSVALCTIITVGWCSFMSDFGGESPRSTKWVTADGNVRITQAQRQQRRPELMKMCVFVCFVLSVIGWGFLDSWSQSKCPIFLNVGPATTQITIFYREKNACENNWLEFTQKCLREIFPELCFPCNSSADGNTLVIERFLLFESGSSIFSPLLGRPELRQQSK